MNRHDLIWGADMLAALGLSEAQAGGPFLHGRRQDPDLAGLWLPGGKTIGRTGV
jgi:hypothetical protein